MWLSKVGFLSFFDQKKLACQRHQSFLFVMLMLPPTLDNFKKELQKHEKSQNTKTTGRILEEILHC